MRVNYHFHDQASSDGAGRLEEHCEAARAAGVTELCVTNHVEVLDSDGEWRVELEEAVARFERVGAAVAEARERYPELELRLGAEFEYRREWLPALDRLRDAVPFDLVIGSLHLVDGWNISGGDEVDRYFEGRSVGEAYGRYFEELAEMVEWGGFDVIGHLDLVKRYGHRHYGPYRPADFELPLRATLAAAADAGLGIEVNASGCFQAPGRPYPEPEILAWAREEGMEVLTLGNDSHRPADIGRGLSAATQAARQAGWTQLCLFESRHPRPVRLP